LISLFVFSLTIHDLHFCRTTVAAPAESFDHCHSSSPFPGLALTAILLVSSFDEIAVLQ